MRAGLLPCLLLVAAAAGCAGAGTEPADPSPSTASEQPGFAPPAWAAGLRLVGVVSNLTQPVQAIPGPEGGSTLYVSEKAGTTWAVDGARRDLVLDVRGLVSGGYEQGYFGLAFHPEFAENGAVFASYTDVAGDYRLDRYRVVDGKADPATRDSILFVSHPYTEHNGGHVVFGPDGMLYVGIGDGGRPGDPLGYAQDPSILLGKILRLDVGPTGPYAVPEDNPLVGREGRPEVWALGLRNPWTFAFHPRTGDMLIADVGQEKVEEIDLRPANQTTAPNFGWSAWEGSSRFDPARDAPDAVPPIHEYGRGDGCAVIGGVVYRGAAIPELRDAFVFGDFCLGTVWALRHDGTSWHAEKFLETGRLLSGISEDAAGELLLIDYDRGAVLRIEPDAA